MANDDRDQREAPSLEPPSLGFSLRRKRKPQGQPSAGTPPEPAPPQPVATEEATDVPPSVEQAPADEPTAVLPPEPDRAREAPATRRTALTAVSAMAAAVITGALVGLLLVGVTGGTLRACEAVRGTSSCGDPGFFLLVTILAALVLVGGALLRAFRVRDPFSTSFLGVGLLTVIALVFLVEVLFAWWMVIVIPVCTAATYAVAHWVTTAFVEPAEG